MLILLMLVAGCGNCGEEKVAPCERPAESRDFITEAHLSRFEDAGVPIYCGNPAPDITGTFAFQDVEVVFTDSERWPPSGASWCHEEVTFEPTQTADVYTSTLVSPDCDTEGEASVIYASGVDGCFTLYQQGSNTFEGCYSESVSVESGCFNEDGDIVEPTRGILITAQDDSPECDHAVGRGGTLGAGERAVTRQLDGFADRVDN